MKIKRRSFIFNTFSSSEMLKSINNLSENLRESLSRRENPGILDGAQGSFSVNQQVCPSKSNLVLADCEMKLD